jgi:hypothetical protein
VTGYPLGIGQHPVRSATQPQRLDLEASKPRPFFLPPLIEQVLRDEFLRGRVYHVGGLGRVTPPHAILETRRLERSIRPVILMCLSSMSDSTSDLETAELGGIQPMKVWLG